MEFPLSHNHCHTTGSQEPWEGGLILGPAQWVKDLVLPQLEPRSHLRCGVLIPGLGIPYARGQPKKKGGKSVDVHPL